MAAAAAGPSSPQPPAVRFTPCSSWPLSVARHRVCVCVCVCVCVKEWGVVPVPGVATGLGRRNKVQKLYLFLRNVGHVRFQR